MIVDTCFSFTKFPLSKMFSTYFLSISWFTFVCYVCSPVLDLITQQYVLCANHKSPLIFVFDVLWCIITSYVYIPTTLSAWGG